MEIYRDLENLPTIDRGAITIGKYDSMHIGHRQVLNLTKKIAEKENRKFIIMSFANHPFDILKPDEAPTHLSTERFKINFLRDLGCDILIYVNFSMKIMNTSHIDFLNFLLEHIKNLHFIQGYDFRFGSKNIGDINFLKEYCKNHSNAHLTIVKKIGNELNGEKISSSLIRKLLSNGNIKKANEYLKRTYYIESAIIEGEKLGRKIGFPTINMYIDTMEYPKNGVYFSNVEIDNYDNEGNTYKGCGMTYVGKRMVKGFMKSIPLIETYIFDFNKSVYGKNARIYFIERIRDVMKFESFSSLKEQLKKDNNICKRILEEKCL